MTNKNMEKIYDMACNQLDQTRSSYAVLESLKDGFNDGLIFKIQCEMDESYEEAKVLVGMIEDMLPNGTVHSAQNNTEYIDKRFGAPQVRI